MSIFKSTFAPAVKAQLGVRQKAINNRTPQNLSYMNSRNAWIRMSSSVNVNGTNELAKKYVLQGGTLNIADDAKNMNGGSLKSGIGNFNNAYSNIGLNPKNPYQRGIRPMPGITTMDIKSKSAYGSLREVTINFQCWDIQQLEDLELLYMRPGYTVLIEWGWTPYLDNNGVYQPNFNDYHDIINSGPVNREDLFKALYDKSTEYGGNYDTMFGYIKNYQWSARPDGGYDCTANVISTGEIIESLKINYSQVPLIEKNTQGLLGTEFSGVVNSAEWVEFYRKNTLAGLWAETFYKLKEALLIPQNLTLPDNTIFKGKSVVVKLPFVKNTSISTAVLSNNSDYQVYITLGAMMDVLNKYVIPKTKTDPTGKGLIELSLDSNGYDGNGVKDLYCTAHPLQLSIDPSVCVIKSPLWYESGNSILQPAQEAAANNSTDINTAISAFKLIQEGWLGTLGVSRQVQQAQKTFSTGILDNIGNTIFNTIQNALSFNDVKKITDGVLLITNPNIYGEVERLLKRDGTYSTLQDVFQKNFGTGDLDTMRRIKISLAKIATVNFNYIPGKKYLNPDGITYTQDKDTDVVSSSIVITPKIAVNTSSAVSTIGAKSTLAIEGLKFLDKLEQPFFFGDKNGFDEIGTIKNIYVNVDFLCQQALSTPLESQDKKEKDEINLYNYLKKIISSIQSSIGNVENFEIHVDPVDNKARIIDVNYTEPVKNKSSIYNSLFQLEVHNLNSVVRSYSLQSQIFPDQSTLVAVGAQAKGGQMGIQNNTLIDFNRNIEDRIIPNKDVPGKQNLDVTADNTTPITNNLAAIINEFSAFNTAPTDASSKVDYGVLVANAKNGLRDIIVYFQSVTISPGSNRNLIPTKFSCEMDGIGGLVIGHMFKLPPNIIPRGYRGEGVGSQLGNVITTIGHTIANGDWVTKIDTLNIVLDDKTGKDFKDIKLDITAVVETIKEAIRTGGNAKISLNTTANFGKVDPSVPKGAASILDLLSYTEGTAKSGNNNGYDIIVGYRTIANWNENYTESHPNQLITLSATLKSTAAGRYQFLKSTWDTTGGKGKAFNKKNQDIAGWNAVLGRKITNAQLESSYNLAASGVTDVTKNTYFLQILGKSFYKTIKGKNVKVNFNLAGGWASIPDVDGGYVYSGQGVEGVGTQDVYNIYLKAVEKYK